MKPKRFDGDTHKIKRLQLQTCNSPQVPKIKATKFKIGVSTTQLRTTIHEAKRLLEELNNQTAIVVALWPLQLETTRKLEIELKKLKMKILQKEKEIIEMKTKRWCRVCDNEAVFMDEHKKFYCSERCEQRKPTLENQSL